METRLVGRSAELDAIERSLGARGGILALEGEPGIGKSTLLGVLAARAGERGWTALSARASELETDLPYALWTEALERRLGELGDERIRRLGLVDPVALAPVVPAVFGAAAGAVDRHRTHRALRDLLERLAAARPLAVCLDDVHWADPASADALAALVRRPAAAPVLLGVAARSGQAPAAVALALAEAVAAGRATVVAVRPLSAGEAAELTGADEALYAASGGNPFYLEQLARRPAEAAPRVRTADGTVPPAVSAAIAAELGALGDDARRLLDAAAVAGDPFELGVAAETAAMDGETALAALDELLARSLVRPTDAPRRFAFRHPVVRHAVYEMTAAGRRLGAHARAAAALERRGAGAVARAHHVAEAAEPGDEEGIALLTAAARELRSPAPASAARCYAAALRLLPDDRSRRTSMATLLADAQSAAGDPAAAHTTLAAALREAAADERLRLTVAIANAEWWLGRYDEAHRRLHVALRALPAEPSADRVRLRLALCLNALAAHECAEVVAQASDARDDARALGDADFAAAALAVGGLARVAGGDAGGTAWLDDSAESLERLGPERLVSRLPAFWMRGRARNWLGDVETALADLRRGLALAADTGRERLRLHLVVESVASLVELGRIPEAVATGEEGVERGRLAGNPSLLLWAHGALSSALLAAGDVEGALREAREAEALGAPPGFEAAAHPAWCLGAALLAAGEPERAAEALERAAEAALPAQRAAVAADLAAARLACNDIAGARRALERVPAGGSSARGEGSSPPDSSARGGGSSLPGSSDSALGRDLVVLAHAELLLAEGRADEAVAAARATAARTPLRAARARLLEGRALAAAGRRDDAIAVLLDAEAAFDGCGARRDRDAAVRELRRLGRRVVRAAPSGDGDGLAALTAREREIAELVAGGRSNKEIAAQLVLSTRTVDAHLRNVFAKLGVRSRVELTRAVR